MAGKVFDTGSILSVEQLKKLTTKRLLAYKNALMSCNGGADWDWCGRLSKEDPEWKKAYADVKTVLSTREHVERS